MNPTERKVAPGTGSDRGASGGRAHRPVRIEDLPAPPPGRTGWPWTVGSEAPTAGERTDDLPTISIVTPSYGQGGYLEGTIRSVLLQGYPKLEYVVIDGGSRDGSVEILERYEPWLTYWVSERDEGQTDAIRKGLSRCSGEVFNWINSDDQLAPGALLEVGRRFAAERPHLLVGRGLVVTEDGHVVHDWRPRAGGDPTAFLRDHGVVMSQPSTFFSTAALEEVGGLRADLHYVMDWEVYLRFALKMRDRLEVALLSPTLSYSLSHEEAKTSRSSGEFVREAQAILRASKPLWRADEWPLVERVLLRRWLEERVGEALERPPAQALRRLITLPVRSPSVVRSRLYWGAVRRALLGRSGS